MCPIVVYAAGPHARSRKYAPATCVHNNRVHLQNTARGSVVFDEEVVRFLCMWWNTDDWLLSPLHPQCPYLRNGLTKNGVQFFLNSLSYSCYPSLSFFPPFYCNHCLCMFPLSSNSSSLCVRVLFFFAIGRMRFMKINRAKAKNEKNFEKTALGWKRSGLQEILPEPWKRGGGKVELFNVYSID